MSERIVITKKRFQRLNPNEDEFHGFSNDQIWDVLKEAFEDDEIVQETFDFILNDERVENLQKRTKEGN